MSDFGSAFGPVRPPEPTHDERQHQEIVDALIGIQVAQDQMVQVLVAMAEAERVAPVIHAAGDGADLSPLLEALSRPHPIPPSPEAIAEALARRLPDHGPLLSAVSEAVAATAKQLERLNKKVTASAISPSGGSSGHVIVDSGTVTLTGSEFPWTSTDRAIANDIKRGLTDHESRLDYDGSNNLIYAGKAPNGTATTATSWQVQRLTYTGANLTRVQVLSGIAWDARATAGW